MREKVTSDDPRLYKGTIKKCEIKPMTFTDVSGAPLHGFQVRFELAYAALKTSPARTEWTGWFFQQRRQLEGLIETFHAALALPDSSETPGGKSLQ